MSYEEKYKVKYPTSSKEPGAIIKKEKARAEPTEEDFCMNLDSKQAWQFEVSLREHLKHIGQRCLEEARGKR